MFKHQGFSLIEIMVMLSVAAILYFIALPSTFAFLDAYKVRQEISQLQSILSNARQLAIFNQTRVRLCPLGVNNSCGQNWNDELVLFSDPNNNRQIDVGEKIYMRIVKNKSNKEVRAFNNSNGISFNAQGFAGYAVGTLSYCFNGKQPLGAAFTISRVGRVRVESNSSLGGGVLPRLANGQSIPCS